MQKEEFKEKLKQVYEYFDQLEEVGNTYEIIIPPELKQYSAMLKVQLKQSKTMTQIQISSELLGKIHGNSASIANLDWCFIYATMEANRVPSKKMVQAYKSWKTVKACTGIDQKLDMTHTQHTHHTTIAESTNSS